MLFGSSQPVVAKASVVINKPVHDVYHFVSDGFFDNYPRWSPEVVELKALSQGPVKLGTMAKQVRVDHGHKSESTFKVSDHLPNQRVCFTGVSNPYTCLYEFEIRTGSDDTTRVTFTFEIPQVDAFMRPFEKLIRVAIQDGANRTVKNIKGLIENG
ncbi:MAG: SRPBCC family protein [Methylococcaceae bacterium]